MQEADNIIRIFRETKQAVEQNDANQLKNLSNQTIHSATVYQDPDNIISAVLIYSLGKIIEREGYRNIEGWQKFYKNLIKNLEQAIKSLEKNDLENFRVSLGKIRNSANKIDSRLKDYISDVFAKAEINKAFKVYEHGISSERTASLLGVSLWDLASYIGQTKISEAHVNEGITVKKRVKTTKDFFASKVKRFLIMDAGPFISLTMNGLLPVLEKIKDTYPGIKIILTPQVKREVVDKPLKIKKYELEAVKVLNLINKGIISDSKDFIPNNKLEKETAYFLRTANNVLKAYGEKVKAIQEGEASCLAFAKLCNCENVIVIDERTTRLITEAPEELKEMMQRKLHTKLSLNTSNLNEFKNFRYIRSPELLFMAYQNNLLDLKNEEFLLDALLYAVKFKGASISSKEIEEMKLLV